MQSFPARQAIKEWLDKPNFVGISAVHIEGQLLAKERASLVDAIWSDVLSTHPAAKAVYTLGTKYDQSEALIYYFDKKSDTNLAFPFSREMPAPDKFEPGNLAIVTHEEPNASLDDVNEAREKCLGKIFTFFVDLGVAPTIQCELMLGRLIRFIRELVRPKGDGGNEHQSRINLVTMGAGEWGHVSEAFYRFLHVKTMTVSLKTDPSMDEFKEIEISGSHSQQTSHVVEIVMKARNLFQENHEPSMLSAKSDGITEGADSRAKSRTGPLIVLFMNYPEALNIMHTAFGSDELPNNFYKTLSLDKEVKSIQDIQENNDVALLIVEPNFPCVVGELPITTVVSTGTKAQMTFDKNSSQFIMDYAKPLSQSELRRQRLWMEKAKGTQHGVPTYYTMYSLDDVQKRPDSAEGPLDGELLVLLFWAIWHWPEREVALTPIPILKALEVEKVLEMWRRLRAMNIIQAGSAAKTWKPNQEIAPLVARYLNPEINLRASIHVAVMIAHAHRLFRTEMLSVKAARIITRFAAIIGCHLPTLVTPDFVRIENEQTSFPDLIKQVRGDSSGVGKLLADHGSLWLALGLWQQVQDSGELNMKGPRSYITIAQHNVRLNKVCISEVAKISNRLDMSLNLPNDDNEVESEKTMLSDKEIEKVNEILLDSWMHQLVLFPYAKDLSPVDLISLRPVDCEFPQTVSLDWVRKKNNGNRSSGPDGFAAIYFNLLRDKTNGLLVPLELTLVPDAAFAKLKQRLGTLVPALTTIYPVPTDYTDP